jgi:transposase-like protein
VHGILAGWRRQLQDGGGAADPARDVRTPVTGAVE